MSNRGRPRKEGLRRPNGRLSEAQGARPDEKKIILAQPHRRAFALLFDDKDVASDARCGFALGRLRLFGLAEERRAESGEAPVYVLGLNERLFQAGENYGAVVARERYARGSPKDKAQAMDWLSARGLSVSAAEMSPDQRARAIADFEDARAVLAAAATPPDLRKAHSALLQQLRQLRLSSLSKDRVTKLARVLPALVQPTASDALLRSVNAVVVADVDPIPPDRGVMMLKGPTGSAGDAGAHAALVMNAVRHGLDALAYHFGDNRRGKSRRPDGAGDAFMTERPSDRPDLREAAAEMDGDGAMAVPTAAKPDRDHPFR